MDADTQNKQKEYRRPPITYPADYKILVQGKLDMSWSERLSGLSVSTTGGKDLTPLTTLRGRLVDQSALLGVLNTLHDLNYAVLQVEYLSDQNTSGK
jgi:hypothetical protein